MVKCPVCGSNDIEKKGGSYVCPYCENIFNVSEDEEQPKGHSIAAKRMQSLLAENEQMLEQRYQQYLEAMSKLNEAPEISEEERERITNETLDNLEITSEFLLKKGEDVAFAGRLYSSVESMLKNTYNLTHIGTQFAISLDEYDELCNKLAKKYPNQKYPICRRNAKGFFSKPVKDHPNHIEMTPNVRFSIAAIEHPETELELADIKTAGNYWEKLNKIRHNKESVVNGFYKNEGIVDENGNVNNQKLCSFWMPILNFFQKHKLCDVK